MLNRTYHFAYTRACLAALGMEAIYEFDVKNGLITAAVDSNGTSVHNAGPKEWAAMIGKTAVVVA